MTSAQTFFIPDSNKSIKITLSLLILGFLLIYILPLGFRPLVIPDESRYAEIPREMIATGDWTVPRLNGLRYFEKPVLGYWLNAMSIQSFGENAFAARFPSAMATGRQRHFRQRIEFWRSLFSPEKPAPAFWRPSSF